MSDRRKGKIIARVATRGGVRYSEGPGFAEQCYFWPARWGTPEGWFEVVPEPMEPELGKEPAAPCLVSECDLPSGHSGKHWARSEPSQCNAVYEGLRLHGNAVVCCLEAGHPGFHRFGWPQEWE